MPNDSPRSLPHTALIRQALADSPLEKIESELRPNFASFRNSRTLNLEKVLPWPWAAENQHRRPRNCTTGLEDWTQARLVRIKSTASLEYIQVSKALAQELASGPELEQISDFAPMAFDSHGNLGGFHEKE